MILLIKMNIHYQILANYNISYQKPNILQSWIYKKLIT